MAAQAQATRFHCLYCLKDFSLQHTLIRHINSLHKAQATNEELRTIGLCRHICGQVTTHDGQTKHRNICPFQDVANDAIVQPINEPLQEQLLVEPNNHINNNNIGDNDIVQPPIHQFVCGTNLLDYGAIPRGTLDLFVALNTQPTPSLIHRHLACKIEVTAAVDRICMAYLAHPSEVLLFRLLAVPKLGIHPNISQTRLRLGRIANFDIPIDTFTDMYIADARRVIPIDINEVNPDDTGVSQLDVKRINRSLSTGRLRKSAQLLRRNSSVAFPTEDVINEMREKHPQGPEQPFVAQGPPPPRLIEETIHTLDTIVRALGETSPGISGWTPEIVQLCYGRPEENKPLRRFLFALAKQILNGTAPGQAMLCCSRLTALRQSPTKLRPIACGELFYRIIAKFILKTLTQPTALLPCQLGVGSPTGTDPIIELMYQAFHDDSQSHFAYSIDLVNAFNSMSRTTIAQTTRQYAPGLYKLARWVYNASSPLVLSNGQILKSSQGVRQGDPLGPLLFSIGLRPQLEHLRNQLPGSTIVTYLDDIFILSQDANLLDTIIETFPAEHPSGLVLNPQKTQRYNLRNLEAEAITGMPVLGSMIGSTQARQQFLDVKINKTICHLQRLRKLPAHAALILLRQCIAPEISHFLRSLDCTDLLPTLARFDAEIHSLVNHLRQINPEMEYDPIAQRITNLPLSRGGLGLFNAEELQPIIRPAAQHAAQYQLLLMNIPLPLPPPAPNELDGPPPSQKQILHAYFDNIVTALLEQLSEKDRLMLIDNSSKIGTAWMHALPISPQLTLTSLEIAAALNERLLGKGIQLPAICRGCTLPMDIIHPQLCRTIPLNGTDRHNDIISTIATSLKRTNWTNVEPTLPNQQHIRRADLRIGNAAVGAALHPTYGHVDIKVKCIFAQDTLLARQNIVRTEEQSLTTHCHNQVLAALQVAYNDAQAAYVALQLQPPVVPVVISSGGTLHPTALKFLKDLLPDQDQRRKLRQLIAISLVRARARVFHWNH
jgi:hypothetical protein